MSFENKNIGRSIDWTEVYRRLEKAEMALKEGWQPDPERQRQRLEERAIQLANKHAAALIEADKAQFTVVEFLLIGERYAIETIWVKEVCAPKDLTPVPGTPSFITGIINVRGQIVSVIDLRKFFALPIHDLTNLNKVIIVRGMGLELGILADEIIGERNLPQAAVPASSTDGSVAVAEWQKKYLIGITSDNLHVLAVEKILADPGTVVREEMER